MLNIFANFLSLLVLPFFVWKHAFVIWKNESLKEKLNELVNKISFSNHMLRAAEDWDPKKSEFFRVIDGKYIAMEYSLHEGLKEYSHRSMPAIAEKIKMPSAEKRCHCNRLRCRCYKSKILSYDDFML